MKNTTTKNVQAVSKLTHDPPSDLQAKIQAAHPSIQCYISELLNEITRLQRHNAKQQVAHFSAVEKIKSECAEEIARDKARVVIYLPDNGRKKCT